MRVSVKHDVHRVPEQRLLEPAAAEERVDFRRLAFDGLLDRRVVQDGDNAIAAKAGEGRLELQGLVDRLVDEGLDDVLPPGTEGTATFRFSPRSGFSPVSRALAERAEPAGAELAVSLTESQLQQLERKYKKINADYRKEWLDRSVEKQHEMRHEKFVERSEDFYGRLDAQQHDLLRLQVARSVFDPRELDAERKRRQREALTLLRRFNAQKTPPAEAQTAIHAYVLRIADPPPGPWRDRQQALQREACNAIAEFHNQTSPAQREKAVRRLQSYENDLRDLAASH